MNADGSGYRLLRPRDTGREVDRDPSWSPDGRRIAFVRETVQSGGNPGQIYVMNADGGSRRRLTRGTTDSEPAWSPDGRYIAFERDGSIWRMRADGKRKRVLLHWSRTIEFDYPTRSPSGREIAVVGTTPTKGPEAYHTDIYIARADGSHLRRVTHLVSAVDPAWSPDGTRIAFSTNHFNSEEYELWLVAPDGTNLRKLFANVDAWVREPTWAPDGTLLAVREGDFSSEAPPHLIVIDLDGNVVGFLDTGSNPDWQRRVARHATPTTTFASTRRETNPCFGRQSSPCSLSGAPPWPPALMG
jgi:TolB protein